MDAIQRMQNTIEQLRREMEFMPEEFRELYLRVIEFDEEYLQELETR